MSCGCSCSSRSTSGAAGARRSTAEVEARTPLTTALAAACPRCGSAGLFQSWIGFVPKCRACGLDIAAFNVGDGPAAFLILVIGALLTTAAIVTELAFEPPYWVHLVWIPIGAALTVFGLRFGKALLLVQEYRHRAREGRIQP